MGKVNERTENGVTSVVGQVEGQAVVVQRPGRAPFTGTVAHIHTAPGYVAVRDDRYRIVANYPTSFVSPVEEPAAVVEGPAYEATYPVHGTDGTLTVTDDEVRGHCATHGHVVTVKSAEYAQPGGHVERALRLHHIEEHGDADVEEPAEVVEEETAEVATVVELLPAALPVAPGTTEARRMAALAGIPQDDEQLCTALRNAGTAATERRAVAMMVYTRYMSTPGAYEEWQRRVNA